jgi:ATP-binding cassette subfamily B protein
MAFRDTQPDRPPGRDLRHLRSLLGFLAPYRLRVAGALLALLVAAGCVLALGQGLRHAIDAGFAAADPGALDSALGLVLGVSALLAVATAARLYLMMSTGDRVVNDLRKAVFDRIVGLDPAYFETVRTGEVISRLSSDTAVLQAVIGYGFSLAFRSMLLLAGALLMLAWTDWRLTLYVLGGAPLVLAPVLALGRRIRRTSRASQDRVADASAFVDEVVHEIRTVQAYGREEQARAGFAARAEAAHDAERRRLGERAWQVGLVMLFAFGGVAVVLWVGGRDVLAGRITSGELSAYVFYCALAAGAAGALAEVAGDLQRAAGATERLMELLTAEASLLASPGSSAVLPAREPEIVFDSVDFAYPTRPGHAALSGFTLRIPAGRRVALVGPSGAGKSTVFSLLLRFYDPQAGAVRIGGVDLRTADPRAVRRLIAVVPQDPVIFAASVLDNVLYGRPDASRADALRACEQAFALEFVDRLPHGADTLLGERGVTLSGGQRQRLSIARALLADRPILLLDEATSSLDAAGEGMVQRALENLERGRTTLVIAHRLATVRDADSIVVIDRGEIVAQGSHTQLMAEGGLYSSLAALQFMDAGERAPRS